MSHFGEAQTEDDLPSWCRGEVIADDDRDRTDEPSEAGDTALTTWLDGYQPTLEPMEALLEPKE
jgi:hypothetical protein